jgi:hypothetical protein
MRERVGFNTTPWYDAWEPELEGVVRLTGVKRFLAPAALFEAVLREPHLRRQARGNVLQFAFTMICHEHDAGSDGDIMYWLHKQLRAQRISERCSIAC